MARSFKICVQDDKGRPIACAWARAFRNDTQAEVETQYTDGSGNATFTSLPDNTDCYIIALWGVQSKFFFSEATIGNTEISDVSISKLTVGNLDVVGTLTSNGKFVTAASPNPRIEITQTLIAGYSDATTKQFYLQASDGKAYFGGGNCYLDSTGITIVGQALYLKSGANLGYVYQEGAVLQIVSQTGTININNPLSCSLVPSATNAYTLGESDKTWGNCYFTQTFTVTPRLQEITTPTPAADWGAIYTKSDNKLYFQDGAGVEHTVAFV